MRALNFVVPNVCSMTYLRNQQLIGEEWKYLSFGHFLKQHQSDDIVQQDILVTISKLGTQMICSWNRTTHFDIWYQLTFVQLYNDNRCNIVIFFTEASHRKTLTKQTIPARHQTRDHKSLTKRAVQKNHQTANPLCHTTVASLMSLIVTQMKN